MFYVTRRMLETFIGDVRTSQHFNTHKNGDCHVGEQPQLELISFYRAYTSHLNYKTLKKWTQAL